jgi:hypothetical protein
MKIVAAVDRLIAEDLGGSRVIDMTPAEVLAANIAAIGISAALSAEDRVETFMRELSIRERRSVATIEMRAHLNFSDNQIRHTICALIRRNRILRVVKGQYIPVVV